MIRVMVVDDHEVVRKGIIAYLETDGEIDIVGQAGSGREGARIACEQEPDVVLMDLVMEDGDGVESTRVISEKIPACKIVILTSFYDDEQVFPAIEAGAFSYILKTSSADEIVAAIKKASKGETVIEQKVAGKMMTNVRSSQMQKAHESLTERELEVLLCIGKGWTNQEIARKLFIGVKTVKTHVSSILSKLAVLDRTQAAVYVHEHALLKQ